MLSDYNFNLNPYYDDFDETKNFYRILFKPGFAVQARELTQLQTQLQDQISKFGDHIFKEGSVVLGGNFYTTSVNYLLVSRNNALSNFDNQTFTGQNSGATGKVIKTEAVDDETARIYFSYTNGLVFAKDEEIVCDNSNTETTVNLDSYLGTATAFSIDEGVFYVYGNFVYCEPQTAIIAIDEAATCRVGLFAEEVIIESNTDTSLLDPALGSYNYSAPGADRYSITLSLISYAYDPEIDTAEENASNNFVELSRFVEGLQVTISKLPLYSLIEDTLARRTYDESGDYTVRSFGLKVSDHVYGNTELLSLQIDPGKAYVKGYEFETIAPTYLDLPKSRTTNFENEFPVYVNYGQYIYVKDFSKGYLDLTSSPTVNLLDSNTPSANIIGTCRVKYVDYDTRVSSTNIYKLYVDGIAITDSANVAVSDIRALNTASFQVNTAVELYSSGTELTTNDNTSYIVEIPKDYVSNITASETSYTTFVRVSDSYFSGSGGTANGTFILTGEKQRFLSGLGTVSASDIRNLFQLVITSNPNGDATLPVGKVLDPTTDGLTINAVSEKELQVTVTKSNPFNATLFAKIGVAEAAVRSKTLATGTIVVQGAALTVSNISSTISLNKSDCVELSSVIAYDGSGTAYDYTNNFEFNTGQTDVLYDHGYIKLKSGYSNPVTDGRVSTSSGNVTVSFSYYTHSVVSGSTFGFFNVDSYPNYDAVPSYTTSTGNVLDLKNCFDFRPRRVDDSTTISGGLMAEPSTTLTTDFTHYLGRIDKLVLTKERKLALLQGIPAINPAVPVDIPDAMSLYIINVPPYTNNKDEVTFTFIENKRYTMRDIGRIEKRVERLEYYTALSLLEKQARDESIPSDVPTIDRFKNGILVDSFAGHSVGDVNNPDYSCSVDYNTRTLRPRFKSEAYTFKFNEGTNHRKSGDLITLDYTTETFINQPLASRWVNLNPYNVFMWNGFVELFPSSDNWVDTKTKPDVIVNMNGENDAYVLVTNQGTTVYKTGVRWEDWKTIVNGVSQAQSGGVTTSPQTAFASSQTSTVSTQLTQVGTQITTGSIQTVTRDLGTKVVDTSIAPFVRSRIVDFNARAMKPSTELIALFDNVDITQYCSPATEIILASGNTVSSTAESIRLYSGNTAVVGTIIGRRTDRIFVKESTSVNVNSAIRFSANDAIYWVGSANSVDPTPVYIQSVVRNTTLKTNDKGDCVGSFVIPNTDSLKFRVGEKLFKLTDSIEQFGTTTSAATKYVALGLSQSVEKTLVSTRIATISPNPANTTPTTDAPVPPPPSPPPVNPVPCAYTQKGGTVGIHTFTVDFGSNTGVSGITYDAMSSIPDRFTLIWDGKEYTTGFVGGTGYNTQLNKLGYPSVVGPRTGSLTFNKTKATPTTALLRIDAPISGTGWNYKVICPSANVVAPQPITTGTINLALSHASSVSFGFAQRDTSNVSTSLKLSVSTTGTSASFIRVTDLNVVSVTDANGVSLPTSTVTISPTSKDFETLSTKTGRGNSDTVNVNVKKPLRNSSRYTVQFSGVARAYNTAADRTSGSNVVLTSNVALTSAVVIRDDSLGQPTRIDPVAQTFFVEPEQYPNGIFLDSIDLYFRSKSNTQPVIVEIRPVVNGYPSSKDIVPFSVVSKTPDQVQVSSNASVATNFKFESPVYLPPGEHSFVAKCNSDEYTIYTAVLGDFLLTDPNTRITSQPSIGSMFKSQNSSTWTPVQEEDVMFRLNKCLFTTASADVSYLIDYETFGDTYFDLFFADGEHLDFAATTIDYYFRTTPLSSLTTEQNWTRYQLGSNVPMNERKIVRSAIPTDLQYRTVLSTVDRNISPVIDLARMSTVLVQNIVNNGELSVSDFLITDYGVGYNSNANVTISGTVMNPLTGLTQNVSNVASAFAEYNANTGRIEINVTNGGSGYLGNTVATITGGGATSNATVLIQNEIDPLGGNALARYITRKVTLAPNFESLDLKTYFLGNVPTGTSVRVYCKVAPISTVFFENEPWREMMLESSGTPSETGFVEYKYKTVGDTALPSGDRFKTFAIKIVMLSSNPVKVPQIRDLRVIALDD